jgi:hypothetical protein
MYTLKIMLTIDICVWISFTVILVHAGTNFDIQQRISLVLHLRKIMSGKINY